MLRTPGFLQGQLIALAFALAGLMLRLALTPLIHGGFLFICFAPGILIAALLAGASAGVGTLVYSTAIAIGVYLDPPLDLQLPRFEWTRPAVFSFIAVLLILVAALVRMLARTLVETEQQALTLAQEASHRTRNVLAIVQAIARQTARGAANLEEFTTVFDARLSGLARAQDLQGEPNGDDLRALIVRATDPFDPARFDISGARLPAPEDHAAALALMLYELATNAVKYGALSHPGGGVSIAWRSTSEALTIVWEERGGPPVAPPTRRGFGSRMLMSSLSAERGAVTLNYQPQGVTCEITLRHPPGAPGGLTATGGEGALGRLRAAFRRRPFTIGPDVSAKPQD